MNLDEAETRLGQERAYLIRAEHTDRTSNFGWAIWHLTKAKAATSIEEAQMHAVAASARAQLQVAAEMGATRGVDPNGPSTWQEEWS